MKPIIITFPTKEGLHEVPGWIVDDTGGLLAIDQRQEADVHAIPPEPAEWAITHLPSGFRIACGDYTRMATQSAAVGIAQRFYREAKARDWNLLATVPEQVTATYKTLTNDEKKAFWIAVAGWKKEEAA